MKLLKSVPPLLLTLMFALLLSAPALAFEDEFPEEQASISATDTVCTLDELLIAVESAQNGDTIILQNQIIISRNCIIGQEEKRITIIPADNFNSDTMIAVWAYEEQNIVLQNIILDGQKKSLLSVLEINFWNTPDSTGNIYFENVQIQNFISNSSTVYVNAVSAMFDRCQILNNTGGRTGGIEIAPNATGKVFDCTLAGNVSLGNGGALCCWGQAKIEGTTITQNQAVNPDSARMGGGIHVESQASCEVLDCRITDNIADLGGGITAFGEVTVIDTVLCNNQGLNGANDIMAFSDTQLSVSYSDGIKSVYSENNPIGFYRDDMNNRFNPENNAVFLGESLSAVASGNQYGARFIFASDLLQVPPEESESPDEQAPPIEPPIEPQEPNTPNISEPSEPDISDTNESPEPNTPDTSEPPVIPVVPNEPGEDTTVPTIPPTPPIPPTIPEPPRSTVEEPPVIQLEEAVKLVLSLGGVTLDTAISLELLGYGDGQLHENEPITRAQIVVLLYRSLTDDSKSYIADTNTFADVANGAWYYDAVMVLSSVDVINGCDGLFLPNDTLTLGQLITMLTRFVEPRETLMPEGLPYTGHWAYDNIVTAVAYGWIDNAAEIEPDRAITRGEAVKFVNLIFEKL